MNTRAKLRVVVTPIFKEKVNERLGQNSLRFLTAYAEEQWRLGNIYRTRNGAAFMEMPPCVKNRHEVIMVKKLDETPAKIRLEDIVNREKATPDGFIPYLAELLGRFVGGVIASLSS